MQIKIPYGKQIIKIQTDQEIEIVKPSEIQLKNEEEIIKNSFKNPIKKQKLKDFLHQTDKILIIVNDATRPTPTAKILKHLNEYIDLSEKAFFIIACGSHREPTEDEFEFIFGKLYQKLKKNIIVHDAKKTDEMVYIGKTNRGTKVSFNKKIFDFKKIITINSVEPHYFAGYTGGRKSFLPGVASYETIETNHTHALKKEACSLKLQGNPVNEDMMEAAALLENLDIFSIQIILTPNSEIFEIVTGDLTQSFLDATKHANKVFCSKFKEKANIVITVAPHPMDINLYQSQKALENGRLALKENGIIILVSECSKGIGPDNFMKLLSSEETPEAVLNLLKQEYKLGYHKAGKIADLASRAQIFAVTNVDENQIKKAFMQPFLNVQEALDAAIKKIEETGEKPHIIYLPYGSLTVPYQK